MSHILLLRVDNTTKVYAVILHILYLLNVLQMGILIRRGHVASERPLLFTATNDTITPLQFATLPFKFTL